jgi:hypothetical protein
MRNTAWTNVVAFELALVLEGGGETVQDLLTRNNINAVQFAEFANDRLFEKTVQDYREEIRAKGLTFRLKARAQAEELLKTSWILIHSIDPPAAVKADLIKHTVKWGDLEPKNTPVENNSGGVSITINLGADRKETLVFDHSALHEQQAVDYEADDLQQ